MLPPIDMELLREKVPGHQLAREAGVVCVVIPAFDLGPGFNPQRADLLIRLAPGYPDVPPDMWWFDPPARRIDGAEIVATQARERHLGREWQRWSRHLTPGQWQSGTDTLESYLAIVRRELVKAAMPRAA